MIYRVVPFPTRDQLIRGMVSCRSTRSSFANEVVCRMHLPVLHTDVARISAGPDGYRPRLERD